MRGRTFWIVWVLAVVAIVAWSQTVEGSGPQLSTADKVAIQSLEQQKAAASKQYQEAQAQELSILREFGAAHPGYTVNQSTFAVEKIPAEEKKAK